MKRVTLVTLATCALYWPQAQAENIAMDTERETTQLISSYRIESGMQDGQPIPADRLQGVKINIDQQSITTLDKDDNELYSATYVLDTSADPWRIQMTATLAPDGGEGSRTDGLIEANGDTVRLIYALPGGETPDDFSAEAGQQMFNLKSTVR